MQASQWTTDIIVITVVLALACALLGYFAAALRQGRQLSQLAAELEQAQLAQTTAVADSAALSEQLKASEARVHELQVAESTLKTKLQGAFDSVTRLTQEQQEAKGRHATLEAKLEQSAKQHHEAVIQHETALTEIRSLNAKVEDYQSRLEQANTLLQQERESVSGLKSALAEEGKKAKGFEAANTDARTQLAELKEQMKTAGEKIETLQGDQAEIKRQETKLRAELDEREASHAREQANFERQKASLSEQFKLLSNEILEAKAQALQESSKLSLSAVMTPFQQSIDTFKREVQEIHHRETTQQGELRKELEQLKTLNQQITAEAMSCPPRCVAKRSCRATGANWCWRTYSTAQACSWARTICAKSASPRRRGASAPTPWCTCLRPGT